MSIVLHGIENLILKMRVFIYDTSFSPELCFKASDKDYKSNNKKKLLFIQRYKV